MVRKDVNREELFQIFYPFIFFRWNVLYEGAECFGFDRAKGSGLQDRWVSYAALANDKFSIEQQFAFFAVILPLAQRKQLQKSKDGRR